MVNGVNQMGECTTCGEVPLRPDGLCSRCGARPLMKQATDSRPRPVQTVSLPNTPAVRRWHAATKALRDDMASRSKTLAKEAESKTQEAQESRRSLGLFDQVLAAIVVHGESAAPIGHPMALNGRWSRDHDVCVECGMTDTRHAGRGLCVRCNSKRKYAVKAQAQ